MEQCRAGWSSPAAAPRVIGDPDPLRSLLPTMCLIGMIVHAAFLGLFVLIGTGPMVAVNMVSIIWYGAMFVLVRRGRMKPLAELGLLGGEIVAHAVLATAYLGWSSGFHYYVLLMVPVTAVATILPGWLKVATVTTAGLAYLGLDLWMRPEPGVNDTPAEAREYVDFIYYVNVLCTLLVLALIFSRYYLLIRDMQAALQVVATTDPLTELPNRTFLNEAIAVQQARASRGHALSFIMCDIDHFKKINDQDGHTAGDDVLRAVSRSMAASVRSTDAIGRWGGEEFLVVLPDTDTAEAAAVADRLREDVAAVQLVIADRPSRVTVTLGVATTGPGESAADAIMRADAALYEGKRSGRDRVVIAAHAAPASTTR